MVIGLISAVTQGVLTGPLTKRWGEPPVIKISMLGSAFALVLIAWAGSYWTLMIAIGLFVFMTAILTPAISSLTSKRVETQQGMAMGLSNSFMSLGRIAGPLLAGFALDLNLILPFISGAVIMLIGFFFSLFWLRGDEPAAALHKQGDQSTAN
jgi:DHA1 family multidrug resistance protein-like MFS transporter